MTLPDERFFAPRPLIEIAAIGEMGEALQIRSVLESLGAVVILHAIGTPGDFLAVLAQGGVQGRFLILSAHGGEGGLVFGEYGEGIDVSMLVAGDLPSQALAGRIGLRNGTVVVSTACLGGLGFGPVFLAGGASLFIGADDYPDGADAVLFVHLLFHRILARHMSPAAALADIYGIDQEFRMFRSYPAA